MDVFSPTCVDDPMMLSDPTQGGKERKLAKAPGALQYVFSIHVFQPARLKHSSTEHTLLSPQGFLAEERPKIWGQSRRWTVFPSFISSVKFHFKIYQIKLKFTKRVQRQKLKGRNSRESLQAGTGLHHSHCSSVRQNSSNSGTEFQEAVLEAKGMQTVQKEQRRTKGTLTMPLSVICADP